MNRVIRTRIFPFTIAEKKKFRNAAYACRSRFKFLNMPLHACGMTFYVFIIMLRGCNVIFFSFKHVAASDELVFLILIGYNV